MRTPAAFLLFVLVLPVLLGLSGCSTAMRASLAEARGDYAQAIALYDEALAASPNSIGLRRQKGLTYFAMKDFAKAEAQFQEILGLAPGDPEASFYLGLSRIGKGEVEAGLRQLAEFRWPEKFYHQKFVRDEAQLLLDHPGHAPDDVIYRLKDALEQGRIEQLRLERNPLFGS